jgi:hydroxymethylbilane synthase
MDTSFSSLRVGTRNSALALAQTTLALQALENAWPSLPNDTYTIIPMKTTGDRIDKQALYDIGGKALFCKELDDGVLKGTLDIAVHSLKDIPTDMSKDLCIAAVLPRADARDALIGRYTLEQLPIGATVGTCSLRRQAQLLFMRPDLHIKPLRGNVPTRIKAVQDGIVDATVLAIAGLNRLSLQEMIAEIFEPDTILPASNQGMIAITCRRNDISLINFLKKANHQSTYRIAMAERHVLSLLQGTCRTPVGVYGTMKDNDTIHLDVMLSNVLGTMMWKEHYEGQNDTVVATVVTENLLKRAGDNAMDILGKR